MKKISKYEVVRELGRGATSTVYLGRDPHTARQVAIKVYKAEAFRAEGDGSNFFQRLFVNESLLAGKLAHPNIRGIYEASIADDYGYLVMEYVSGTTLERFTSAGQLLPLPRVLEIVYQSAQALDYAQRKGIIHRDIKPANIMLSSDGEVKVSDFGAALNTRAKHAEQVTAIGSLAYMSPEQTRDQPLTFHTDIYSLGVLFYRMLTGSLPFNGSSDASLMYQIQNLEAPPPSKLRPELPQPFDAIIARALAKTVDKRYPSWDAFTAELLRLRPSLEQVAVEPSQDEKFAMMRELRFFKPFTDAELREVIGMARWYNLPMDTTLIRQGDRGHSFFILVSGDAQVTKNHANLNVLRAGDCFGEMAYLSRRKFQRLADVIALSDVTVMEIDPDLLWLASSSCQERFNSQFLEILVERLHAADNRLVELLNEAKLVMFEAHA